jgi:ribulose-phosphate 3-epimerase
LPKLRQLRGLAPPNTLLSIDGGIGPATIGAAADAGAQVFVTGSAIFDHPDYATAIREMKQAATRA